MSEHTPGPWKIVECERLDVYPLEHRGVENVALQALIARVSPWDGHGPQSAPAIQARANARLIQAAPDMLSACEHAFRVLSKLAGPMAEDARSELQNAIAKAKGESTC